MGGQRISIFPLTGAVLFPGLQLPLRIFEPRYRAMISDVQGYQVDWNEVTRLDDASLINGVSQIAPFDAAAKQALLESATISTRCELLVQLMQFFGRRDGDDGQATLQ